MNKSSKEIQAGRFLPFKNITQAEFSNLTHITQEALPIDSQVKVNKDQGPKEKNLIYKKPLNQVQITAKQMILALSDTISTKTTKNSNKLSIIPVYRTLEIDELMDYFYKDETIQYYYNNMDVNKNDFVGFAFKNMVYMARQEDKKLVDFRYREKYSTDISCVKFDNSQNFLLCGDNDGMFQLIDIQKERPLRQYRKHKGRLGKLQVDPTNQMIVYSGSQDSTINVNDLREKNAVVGMFELHKKQIFGLQLKGKYLASSSVEGYVNIFDLKLEKVVQNISQFKGSFVKALSWCPWKSNMLAIGGTEEANSKIILYNMDERKIEQSLAQRKDKIYYSSICWRKSTKEMIYSYWNDTKQYGKIKSSNYFNKNQSIKLLANLKKELLYLGIKTSKRNDNILISLSDEKDISFFDMDKELQKLQGHQLMDIAKDLTI